MSIANHGHGVIGGWSGAAATHHAADHLKAVELAAGIVDKREATDQVSQILNERGKRYGDFSDHARVCQNLKDSMMTTAGSKYQCLSPDKKQALDVICDKMARILTGDPEYDDNWIDIQGYAKLAQERLDPNQQR